MESKKRGRPALPKIEIPPTLKGEIYKERNTFPTPAERSIIIKECIEYHKPLFDRLGVTNPKFFPKKLFDRKGVACLPLFLDSEFNRKPDGFFTEIVNPFYTLPDVNHRVLLHLPYNPKRRKEDYEINPHNTSEGVQYLVPVEEFEQVTLMNIVIKEARISQEKENNVNPVEDTTVEDIDLTELPDLHMSNACWRDWAAALWKKPVSKVQWINDLVNKHFPENGRQ